MCSYSFVAVDARGLETRGTLEVSNQTEAIQRIREMGFFPIRVSEKMRAPGLRRKSLVGHRSAVVGRPGFLKGRVKSRNLAVFTRQLGTLLEAGMPLLRGLRLLAEQEGTRSFKRIIEDLARSIESGSSLAEAMSAYPRAFDSLYIGMVKAGEISGAIETTLLRLAEFREKSRRIKGKVKAAMVYPCAVLTVA